MATVTGSIKLPDQTDFVGSIVIRPLDTPLVDTPDLISTADITVTTDATGDFSQALAAGTYRVWVGASKPFLIEVPDGATTHALIDLITSTLDAAADYTWTPGETPDTATTTTAGVVKTSSDEVDPVALLTVDGVWASKDGQSFRVSGGNLQLWNPVTGKWHTLFATGAEDTRQLALGPGED